MQNITEKNISYDKKTTKKKGKSSRSLTKIFIYICLILFTLSILVPLGWSILAAFKHKSEFYGNPWALPESFYLENFKNAFVKSNMGEYFLNSVFVTALALVLLLVIAIPASYVLSRFEFKSKKVLNTIFAAGLFINVNYIVVPIFLLILDADKAIKDMENSKEQKKSRYKVECLYGRYLVMEKNPVLHQYLVKERQVFENILDNLFKQPESEKIAVRMEEVKEALGYNEAALAYYRT